MNVALRLFNKGGKRLVDYLLNNDDIELSFFVDANDQKWGTLDEEYKIQYLSPYKLLKLMEAGEIDRLIISPFSNWFTINDVIQESINMGISGDRILVPSIPDIERIIGGLITDINECTIDKYNSLSRLQFHIADHCNMKCAACSHFSSLVTEELFMDKEELERDLKQLRKIVKHFDNIDILGGEPLLNKDWKEFVSIAKGIYPYSEISIITNGLLLWSLSDSDWSFLKENNVFFRMSLYKPMWNRADEIVDYIKKKGVRYNVNFRVMSQFATMFLREHRGSAKDNRLNCTIESSGCNQLYHGRLTPCSRMMYVGFFNKYYGLNYPEEVAVNDIYDIKNFQELVKLLNRPMALCEHCNIHLNNQVFEDWCTMPQDNCNKETSLDKWIS